MENDEELYVLAKTVMYISKSIDKERQHPLDLCPRGVFARLILSPIYRTDALVMWYHRLMTAVGARNG